MSVEALTTIKWMEVKRDTIVHYPEVKDFCSRPYPDHLKGCPNIEKCLMLNIPPFDIIDDCGEYNYYYIVYCTFNRNKYRESKGGRDNMRWWQGSLKSILKKEIIRIKKQNKGYFYVYGCGSGFDVGFQRTASMEHCCINVFSTMKLNGVKLDIKPKDKVILVCMLSSIEPLILKQEAKQITLEVYK